MERSKVVLSAHSPVAQGNHSPKVGETSLGMSFMKDDEIHVELLTCAGDVEKMERGEDGYPYDIIKEKFAFDKVNIPAKGIYDFIASQGYGDNITVDAIRNKIEPLNASVVSGDRDGWITYTWIKRL